MRSALSFLIVAVTAAASFAGPPGPVCGPNGCSVNPATGLREVPPIALPDGWKWVDHPNGYGLMKPDGSWYKTPDPEHKARVRSGMHYVPTPEHGIVLGYWRGVCVRDGACDGPVSACVTMSQDGQPVDAKARDAIAPHNPNAHESGYERRLKPCPLPAMEIKTVPLPFELTPPAPALPPVDVRRIDKVPAAKTDPRAACVSVFTGAPGTTGQRFGGSGVVIAAGDARSLVVTNNHIFSEQHHPDGGFRDDVYPQPATVRAGGNEYRATALAADRMADIAVVLVEAQLTPAAVAKEAPAVGSKVWRNGIGSGYQTCTVATPEFDLAKFSLTVNGASVSGDSGAGYFNEKNELVGIHCGQDTSGRPRGTAVRFVQGVLGRFAPARLDATGQPAPVPVPAPAPKVDPQPKVNPQLSPAPAPTVTYRQVTYVGRFGRRYTTWEPVQTAAPSVSVAPAPQSSILAAPSGCANGSCPVGSKGLFLRR